MTFPPKICFSGFGKAGTTVLLFNKIWDISRTAWEVELGPHKLAGWCSWPSPKNINFRAWWSVPKISKSWSDFFSKKYFLRKKFIEFPNKNIFQPTFSREKKSRNVDIFAIFSLENVGRKNIFVRKFNENFSKKIFFDFFFGPTFRNFWNIAPSSKVYISRGWSWTLTCELAGAQLNFPCCALNFIK